MAPYTSKSVDTAEPLDEAQSVARSVNNKPEELSAQTDPHDANAKISAAATADGMDQIFVPPMCRDDVRLNNEDIAETNQSKQPLSDKNSVSNISDRPRNNKRSISWGSYLVLFLVLGLVLFPVYFLIVGSFMTPRDIASYPVAMWPKNGITFDSYRDALDTIPLLRQYGNTFVMALGITIAQLVTSVCAAYALVFMKLKRPQIWFGIFIVSMMIPGESTIIPNYLLLSEAGLMNSFSALILPFVATGFGVFLIRQSFLSFSKELRDAAMLDGCGHIRFMWSVLLPLTKPALAALGMYSFMTSWNMFLWPLLVTRTPEMQTIQIGITQLKSFDSYNPGMILAGAVLAVIPAMILIFFGQKFIVRGLTAGSFK